MPGNVEILTDAATIGEIVRRLEARYPDDADMRALHHRLWRMAKRVGRRLGCSDDQVVVLGGGTDKPPQDEDPE